MPENYAKQLARIGLEMGAIKINSSSPFVWSSGYRMPIYNDSRLFLGNYRNRELVSEGFQRAIVSNSISYDIIFGVATAGISPATTLADSLKTDLGYVRSVPKDHGLGKQVEGPSPNGKTVLLIEELISTGRSSARAVQALRNEGATVNHCLCIFDYGFKESQKIFDGLETFDKEDTLTTPCQVISLFDYDVVIDTAIEINCVSDSEIGVLRGWKQDPLNWGRLHGFRKIER